MLKEFDISHAEQKEWQIALGATVDGINRTRRTLVVIVALACLGLFHFYMWYGNWDMARLAGREAGIASLEHMNADGKFYTGTLQADRELIKDWRAEIEEITAARANSRLELPVVGVQVATVDLSIAIQIAGVASLLWLIFNQKRLNFCIRKLEHIEGWGIPKALIELHFGLVGAHSSGIMKVIGRLLPLGLPTVSLLFIASDIFDIVLISRNPQTALYFNGLEYRIRVWMRLTTGIMLATMVSILGFLSYREWRKTEDELLRFANDDRADG